jgi:hypothetical protein
VAGSKPYYDCLTVKMEITQYLEAWTRQYVLFVLQVENAVLAGVLHGPAVPRVRCQHI